jgi:hypothetical protein
MHILKGAVLFTILFQMHARALQSLGRNNKNAATQRPLFSSSRTDTNAVSSKLASLDASRLGLDPTLNRFHAPLVYHEKYSFEDWPKNHTFPVGDKDSFFLRLTKDQTSRLEVTKRLT